MREGLNWHLGLHGKCSPSPAGDVTRANKGAKRFLKFSRRTISCDDNTYVPLFCSVLPYVVTNNRRPRCATTPKKQNKMKNPAPSHVSSHARMLAMWFVVIVMLSCWPQVVTVHALPVIPSVAAKPCPLGWTYSTFDDSCNAVWPLRSNRSTALHNLPTLVSYHDAVAFCQLFDAELPVIVDLTTQLAFLQHLAGTSSGRRWWIGLHADPSEKNTQRWIDKNGRSSGFVFDWDAKRNQPGAYDGCIVMHQNGTTASGRVFGGNGKMITYGCEEKAHVICTKQRVPVSITGLDGELPHRIEFVEGSSLQISFYGNRIPNGTLVTLQSMTPEMTNLSLPDRSPTRCRAVSNVTGVQTPFTLIPDDTLTSSRRLCNGTCMTASITIPSNWPFVRGARYSLCFFVPVPHFTEPNDLAEYQHELLGPDAFVEVVQSTSSFLTDVCTHRRQGVDVVVGTGLVDSEIAEEAPPYMFESPIEGAEYQQQHRAHTEQRVPWGH